MTLTVCFSPFSITALADSSVTNKVYSDAFITKNLTQNTDIMDELFGDNAQERFDKDSSVLISISPDKKTAIITLSYNDTICTAVLNGTYNEVASSNGIGYVGVYEGFVSPIQNRSLALNTDEQLPIIADITFTDSDIFAVLTLGYATETQNPDILFYGDYSAQVANISNTNATQYLAEAKIKHSTEDETAMPMSVDGTCKFQGHDTVYFGSHMAGILSIFHADELSNQGNMSTYVKVNTISNMVKNYIEDDLGFGSYTMMAYPDTFNISICGNNNNLHAVTNSYTPQNNATSSTISIPVYGGSIIGLQFISFDITMSSTTVTPSKYSSSSPHLNNKLSWVIYKKNGWNPDTFDGGYATESGMTASSTYTYEGNVTSKVTKSMTATGSIRYEYWIMIMGNLSSYHLSTGTMSKTTNVTICP